MVCVRGGCPRGSECDYSVTSIGIRHRCRPARSNSRSRVARCAAKSWRTARCYSGRNRKRACELHSLRACLGSTAGSNPAAASFVLAASSSWRPECLILWLSGPAVHGDGRPNGLDRAEGPCSLQEPVDRSEHTRTRERQNEPATAIFQRVADQHRGNRA
jgi:hypothetical protein